MSKWREENSWCDACGEYDCRRHSFLQTVLTAAIAGSLVGFLVATLFLIYR